MRYAVISTLSNGASNCEAIFLYGFDAKRHASLDAECRPGVKNTVVDLNTGKVLYEFCIDLDKA